MAKRENDADRYVVRQSAQHLFHRCSNASSGFGDVDGTEEGSHLPLRPRFIQPFSRTFPEVQQTAELSGWDNVRSSETGVRIVLASASETRARVLAAAGIPFEQDAADIDEGIIKRDCRQRGTSAEQAALALAESKAQTVVARHPGALVIGADQLLVSGSDWLDKPATPEQARQTLRKLRARRHQLVSGMVVVRDSSSLCRHVEVAELTMRDYSDRFIDWYIETAADADLQVVGACRLEGLGAQAFAEIQGDYFTILGLPLLRLLDVLRREAVLID